MKASKKLLAVIFAVVASALVAGCGGGGGESAENKELTLGVATGWDENAVVANLTKQLLEEDLGYSSVELQDLELGLVFEGVANGDLAAFQDMWLPNHQAQLDAVENDVVQLDPWYQGETEFGIGVPYYMDITSIPELNETDVDQILGIEPGAIISERIPESVIPTYDLNQEYLASSTAAMLAEVESRYSNQEEFAFTPWRPHWMNARYDFKFLEDPEDALGNLNDGATISSIVNEDLPDEDPVAYAFMDALTLTEEQVNEIENINPNDYAAAVSTWLEEEENREAVQPWIDAAREAQES
ncbi:glycine betaine ABC transporter substrate-binding protein [soil metagenome]|jgi:glycine betaine/proline transport system substrate-binding protein